MSSISTEFTDTTPDFARLETVDIRAAWPNEAQNFTPWLYANLDRLSEAIGIPLEAEGSEVAVETFSADILARSALDDTRVLIENQLGCSDHMHLGQIMTYLAGLEAKTIVWVATEFREPHLSAIEWLNESTDEEFAFFAVKVKVVRIGDSPLAPIFDVVARPNNWERQLSAAAAQKTGLSENGKRNLAFWTRYMERHPDERQLSGDENGAYCRWRKLSDLELVLSLNVSKRQVLLFVRGYHDVSAGETMKLLEPHRGELADKVGLEMSVNGSGFLGSRLPGDPYDPAQRDALIDWLYDAANRYQAALYDIFGDGA